MPTTKDKLLPISPETATRKKKEGEKKNNKKDNCKAFRGTRISKKANQFRKNSKVNGFVWIFG